MIKILHYYSSAAIFNIPIHIFSNYCPPNLTVDVAVVAVAVVAVVVAVVVVVVVVVDLLQFLHHRQLENVGELGELLQQTGFDWDGRFQGMYCEDVDGVMVVLGLLLALW